MSTLDIGFRTEGVIAMGAVETARKAVLDALASDPAIDAVAAQRILESFFAGAKQD